MPRGDVGKLWSSSLYMCNISLHKVSCYVRTKSAFVVKHAKRWGWQTMIEFFIHVQHLLTWSISLGKDRICLSCETCWEVTLANYDPVLHTCATSPYVECNLCCWRCSHNHSLFGLRFFPVYANYTSAAVLQVLVKEQDISKTAISLPILFAQIWFCILATR
jgi:hypothetical protein